MKRIFGQIRTAIPKHLEGMQTIAKFSQPPIEGVKVTDGEKVAFSDKDGKYEIETDKRNIEFSKDTYDTMVFDTNSFPIGSPFQKDIFLQKFSGTKSIAKEETILGVNKSKFYIVLGTLILLGVGAMVIIPKLKK